MKQTHLLIPILCLALLLSGCNPRFDSDSSIDRLQTVGFKVTLSGTTPEKLKAATAALNTDILVRGGNFTVELIAFTNLRKTVGSDYVSCQFHTFANANQAQQYYDLMIRSRAEFYKLSLQGTLVIFTNSEEAIELLDLEFA